jgi:hypothetical protein
MRLYATFRGGLLTHEQCDEPWVADGACEKAFVQWLLTRAHPVTANVPGCRPFTQITRPIVVEHQWDWHGSHFGIDDHFEEPMVAVTDVAVRMMTIEMVT